LAIAFEYCDAPDVFAAAIEGYEPSQIEDAIAVQPGQPRRQELTRWYEAAPAPSLWGEKIKLCSELLLERMGHGLDAIKALLLPWSQDQRWAALLYLEEVAPEKLDVLEAIAPSLFKWCDA
jgi:hypothetical protein